ncbi:hypothetical protein VKS41_007599 [Umbelopsis sp. WA50703]
MQALETASRQETDDIDSDSNHSDLVNDAPENASRDVVEDFARKLDQLVINQQQSRGEDDDDQDDEMVDDGFGYQQLPQDADGPELDSGDNETEVVDHERSQPGRTDPIEYQTNEDNSIPEDQVQFIKNVMSKIQLPAPGKPIDMPIF